MRIVITLDVSFSADDQRGWLCVSDARNNGMNTPFSSGPDLETALRMELRAIVESLQLKRKP